MSHLAPSEVAALIATAFPQADIQVTGEGNKYDVRIVDERFGQMRPVARQQAVYAPLNESIANGSIHAVTIRALTPEEARKAALFGQ